MSLEHLDVGGIPLDVLRRGAGRPLLVLHGEAPLDPGVTGSKVLEQILALRRLDEICRYGRVDVQGPDVDAKNGQAAHEFLGAVGLLVPVTRVAAAVCLLLLMVAMFPANIYAARMPNPPKSMTTQLPLRTAEEIVYLAAAVVVAIGGC